MKTLIALLLVALGLSVRAQSKTWGGSSTAIFPNFAPSSLVISKAGTNTLTVNNVNAAVSDTVLARFQQQGTNQLTASYAGGLTIGPNTAAISGYSAGGVAALISFKDISKGENNANELWVSVNDSSTNAASYFDTYGGLESWTTSQSTGDNSTGSEISFNTAIDNAAITQSVSGVPRTKFWPAEADGSTPYTFDTSLTHTSGSLVEVKNNGTNQLSVGTSGRMAIGIGANIDGIQQYNSIYSYFDESSGDPNNNRVLIGSRDSSNYNYDGEVKFVTSVANTNSPFAALNMLSVGASGGYGEAWLGANAGNRLFEFYDGVGTTTSLAPDAAAGVTSYNLDTSLTHTSGYLLAVKNNGTNKFSVSFDGAVTTGDPLAAAAPWKLGTVKTGVTVGLVVTNYVEVNIGGTVVKLAIVQ